jgi:hypothetical protein
MVDCSLLKWAREEVGRGAGRKDAQAGPRARRDFISTLREGAHASESAGLHIYFFKEKVNNTHTHLL